MTDFNPFQVLPETTANLMASSLSLAIEMARAHYPHMVSELEFAQKRYRETALGFIGSHNMPSNAKHIFVKED